MANFTEIPITDYVASVGDAEQLSGQLSGQLGGQLIDVREPSEFVTGSLDGAVNIPLGEVPSSLASLDPARPVIVFCRSGGRSRQAAEFLAGQGFDVTNLDGGMLAYELS